MKRLLLTAPAIVVIMVLTVVGGAMLYWVTAPTHEQLRQQGNQIIVQLETYHDQNDVYPSSAEDVGIELPNTRYGRWKYKILKDGRDFYLSVGEYDGLKPFVLYWYSERGEWYLDD